MAKSFCSTDQMLNPSGLHNDDHSTHILHPTPGYASVLCKKDGYQSYFPVITNKSSIPIPACLNNLIHPAPEHNLKIKTTFTLKHQSLDAEPQHAVTMYNPYNNTLVGNKTRHNKKMNEMMLCAVKIEGENMALFLTYSTPKV